MSSNTGRYFGKGPGEPSSTDRGIPQLQSGNGIQIARNLDPSEMLRPEKMFVPGMRLEGYGFDPLKKRFHKYGKNSRKVQPELYHKSGSETVEDPSVSWVYFDHTMSFESREAHSSIAHDVAKANGFACIIIRKGIHDEKCVYGEDGRRKTRPTLDGKTTYVTTPSDKHMTVWMGKSPDQIMVGGHIYLTEAVDPKTGKLVPLLMIDPVNQRDKALLQPGRELVAEEFWLVQDAWETSRE